MIGIVINTGYHNATGLCLYKILNDLGVDVSFKILNNRFNFRGLCEKYNLKVSDYEKYDMCFVVTEKEQDYVPNFSSPTLKNNKLIFINHRPLKTNNITQKFFPKSLNLANGIYESPYSDNYFLQVEYPFAVNSLKTESIGVTCNFLNKGADLNLVENLRHKLSLPMTFIGRGSKNLSDNSYQDLSHVELFDLLSRQKFLLLPYTNNEYIDTKISETYTHSISLEIPLICYSKFMTPYNLPHLSLDNKLDLNSFDYNNFCKQVKKFKEDAAVYNKNIITKYLEML